MDDRPIGEPVPLRDYLQPHSEPKGAKIAATILMAIMLLSVMGFVIACAVAGSVAILRWAF